MYIKKYKIIIIAIAMTLILSINNVKAESITVDIDTSVNFAYAYNYSITGNSATNQNIINNKSNYNVGGYHMERFNYTLSGANHFRFRLNADNRLKSKYKVQFLIITQNRDFNNFSAMITVNGLTYNCTNNNTFYQEEDTNIGTNTIENNQAVLYTCKNVELDPSNMLDIQLWSGATSSGTGNQQIAISRYITFQKEDTIQESIDKQTSDIVNPDISQESKEEIDSSKFDNYEQKEQELHDIVKNTDISGVGISMDIGTNTFIWNIIERIKNSNVVFSAFIINILSLGVIKLIFAR